MGLRVEFDPVNRFFCKPLLDNWKHLFLKYYPKQSVKRFCLKRGKASYSNEDEIAFSLVV
jgi:hypothetical protein